MHLALGFLCDDEDTRLSAPNTHAYPAAAELSTKHIYFKLAKQK